MQVQLFEFRFGRGVGPVGEQVPMSDPMWSQFQETARDILLGVAQSLQAETVTKLDQWVEVHTGGGKYAGQDEESSVATLYTTSMAVDLFAVLYDFAAELARDFAQHTVAVVSLGQSTLVPPAE